MQVFVQKAYKVTVFEQFQPWQLQPCQFQPRQLQPRQLQPRQLQPWQLRVLAVLGPWEACAPGGGYDSRMRRRAVRAAARPKRAAALANPTVQGVSSPLWGMVFVAEAPR